MEKLLSLLLGLSLCTNVLGQDSITFVPTKESKGQELYRSKGTFYLSPGIESVAAFSGAFHSQEGSNLSAPFRYAIPNNYFLEIGFNPISILEIGLSAGWEVYDSRFNVGSASNLDFQRVSLRSYPVKVIVRAVKGLSNQLRIEGEGGIGMSFGSLEIIRDSDISQNVTESLKALRAHLGGGLGMEWSDQSSMHLIAGYGLVALGSKDYYADDGNIENISRSNISGVYFKGAFRINF